MSSDDERDYEDESATRAQWEQESREEAEQERAEAEQAARQ